MSQTSINIDVNCLHNIVDLLVKNQDRLIDQLDPNKDHELSESITRLKIFTDLFYKTDVYRQLSNLIDEYRRKVTPNTNPGTIGNFLFGCTVNQECTPACFQGIPPNNLGVCDKQVWILDKTLNRVNKGFSSEALVYIVNDTVITLDHLETLRKSDVKKAIVMKYINGKYQMVETIDLTNTIHPVNPVHPTPKTSSQEETKSSNLWWLWLLIILVVLILIGIVVFFVIRRRQGTSSTITT